MASLLWLLQIAYPPHRCFRLLRAHHEIIRISTMPHIVSKVFPTAYVTVYPSAGTWLLAWSQTKPSEAVVVRAPEIMPSRSASWKRKIYLPIYIPKMSGTVVATAPQRNRLIPWVFKPFTKPGPAEIPTMAIKMFRPTEFMNQTVGDGMRPKVGRTDLNHPQTIPEMSAPPAVDNVSGIPATFHTSAPSSAPTAMPAPMNATSATSVARSALPRDLATAAMSWVRPTRFTMSPR